MEPAHDLADDPRDGPEHKEDGPPSLPDPAAEPAAPLGHAEHPGQGRQDPVVVAFMGPTSWRSPQIAGAGVVFVEHSDHTGWALLSLELD